MKINVDAALSKNSTTAAMAAVAWDDIGKFQGASALVMEGITDAETAEALACREGLNLASDLLAQRNLQGKGMGPYGPIVRELSARRGSFALVDVTHENRGMNGDAHMPAKSSLYSPVGRHVWFLYPPEGVCNSHSLID
ncbi:hypothetical protein EJB05_34852, partial [Eragrostis curvula]